MHHKEVANKDLPCLVIPPGRKPNRSPASTAGRVKMILSTLRFLNRMRLTLRLGMFYLYRQGLYQRVMVFLRMLST